MFKILNIFSHEDFINAITNNNADIKHSNFLKESHNQILILEASLVHNIGIPIIKNTLTTYNNHTYKIIVNCNNSLSYCILAIEYKIPYILVNIDSTTDLNGLITLAKQHGSVIFDCEEKIFAHFNN